jgi:hypothetical protein
MKVQSVFRWSLLLFSTKLLFFPAKVEAITVIPCDPSQPGIICGVSGSDSSGSPFAYNLFSGTPRDAYGDPPSFLVTTESEAISVMQASADALNAFALTVPFDPAMPPVLFGSDGLQEFKIAFEEVFIGGERFYNSRRSRWEMMPGRWEIVPVTIRIPAGERNVWTTAPVPGPLPLLGVGAAYGLSRKLRRRIKSIPPVASAID